MSLVKIDKLEEQLQKIRMHLPDYLKEQGHDISNGKKIKCLNPNHDDRSPSMSSFTVKEGHEQMHCFACGFNADIFTAAHVLEHKPIMGPGFIDDNVLYLAKKYDIEVPVKALTEEEIYEMSTYQAYKAATDYLARCPMGEAQLAELAKREWDPKFAKENLIVCCDDFPKFRTHMKTLGFSAKFLDEIDLGNDKIFAPSNLIFTVCDEHGRPVGFAARNLNFDGVKDVDTGRLINGTKFNNTRTTGAKCNIYRKSERLYLMHKAKRKSPPLYIFEGYGDAITLQQAGLEGSVAIGALELSEHHLNTCRRNGCYDVVFCLDGDKAGQEKAKALLDEVLHHVHDIKIRFIFLEEKEVKLDDGSVISVKVDPDSYVRENGLESFMSLRRVNPFEWRLQEFEREGETDPETICFSMIPIIMNEPSPIRRQGMVKELSDHTGFPEKVIKEELDKLKSTEDARIQLGREAVVDNMISSLKNRKESFEVVLQKASDDLYKIDKDNNGPAMDANTMVNNILAIKQYSESEDLHVGLNFGENFRTLKAALSGDLRQKMILLGGGANTGKTTKFANLAWNLASLNDDVIAIVLTIDDSAKEFVPRLVSYDIAKRNYDTNRDLFDLITINKIATPFLYKNNIEYDAIMEEKEISYRNLLELSRENKMVVLDSNGGRSIDYIRNTVRNYTELFPDKRVIMFIDNFHLVDMPGYEDGRTKYKNLSNALKQVAVQFDSTIISTVEYTKIPKGIKPSNNNLAETVQLEYDSNCIMHLYSELHDLREESPKFFLGPDGVTKYPIIEEAFGKNKINSFKGDIFYKFYPEKAFYMEVTRQQVEELVQSNLQHAQAEAMLQREAEQMPALNRFG